MHRLFSLCLLIPSLAVAQDKLPSPPSIAETGEGKASAVPDQGRIRGGVVTAKKTAADALSANSAGMDAVRKAIGAKGVDLTLDVQTTQFSIEDHYSETVDSGGRRTHDKDGYTVTHKLNICVNRLDDLGSVLDLMVAAGANDIDAISFDSSKATEHQDAARTEAVKDAKRRAELIAGALGYTLGDVIETIEVEGRYPTMESATYRVAAMGAPGPPPTAISGGSLEYRSRVSVKWGLVVKP